MSQIIVALYSFLDYLFTYLSPTISSSVGNSRNTYVFGEKYVRTLTQIRTYFGVNTYVFLEY